MKKVKENVINLILIFLIIVLVLACKKELFLAIGFSKNVEEFRFVFPLVNTEIANDTFFTIAMGRDIVKNGIQKNEILTWHNELKFSNPRWLYDVFLNTVYNMIGFEGIYFYTIAMTIFILGLVFFVSYKMNKNWKISFVYTMLSWYLCRYSYYARAWQFSFIFIILEFYFLQKIIEDGKLGYSIAVVIMGILLANMHSSVFPIYLVIFVPYIAEQILFKLGLKIPKLEIEEVKNFKKLIITFILTFICGLLNPFGLLPYTYIVKNMSGFSKTFIGEIAPTTFENNKLFFTILLIILPIMINGKQKVRIVDIFYILGFSILTLAAYRSFYYFVFISGMCIVRIVDDFFKYNDWKINKVLARVSSALSILLFMLVLSVNMIRAMDDELLPENDYPIKLANYILENVDMNNMKLYNDFNYGSYLEFRGIKTFIDSRSEVFCEEFNDCTILKDWYGTYMGNIEYSDTFEKYGITHIVTQKSQVNSKKIKKDNNWNLVYEDEYWELYEKNNELK